MKRTVLFSILLLGIVTNYAAAQNEGALEARANFYWSWTPGPTIGLINNSTGSFSQSIWDMGDGTILNGNQPGEYTYQQEGEYTVTLTVVNSENGFSDTDYFPIVIGENRCTVAFKAEPAGSPGTFNFRAYPGWSLGPTHTLQWDFGDGNVITGINQFDLINVQHTYEDPSQIYTTSLSMTYTNCSGMYELDVNASLESPCFADFTFEAISEDGMTVQFFNTSSSINDSDFEEVFWAFDQGPFLRESEEVNPTFVFYDNGTYNLTLTVYDQESQCSSTITEAIEINGDPPLRANFKYFYPPVNPSDEDLIIIPQFSGDYNRFEIDMGNGDVLTSLEETAYAYDVPGDYEICATVFNDELGESATYCLDFVIDPECPVYFSSFILDDQGTVYFDATYPNFIQPFLTYSWDFGDGSAMVSTSESAIVHQYPAVGGSYDVVLTLTSADGSGNVNCVGSFDLTIQVEGDEFTSISDFDKNKDFRVYPNPSRGQMTLELDGSSPMYQLKLIDSSGQTVYADRLAGNVGAITRYTLDLFDLSNGYYTMIINNAEKVMTQKIMLQR
jgi:PKD repeat protein